MSKIERLEQIVEGCLKRRADGERVDPEEVVQAHPDLAESLRERLASLYPTDATASRTPC